MRRKKEGSFWTSWGMIIFLFLVFQPAAVVLLLYKLFGKDRQEMEEAPPLEPVITRATVDTRINKPTQTVRTAQRTSRPAEAVRQATKTPAPKKSSSRALTIWGVVLALVGLLWLDEYTLTEVITAFAFMAGGAAMFVKGRMIARDMKRYAKYLPVIGDREAVSVEELSRVTGEPVKTVEKDLQEMVSKGYFGGGAYLHRELGYLFRSSEADRVWREKQAQAQAEAPREAEEGYSGILRNIRRANDQIADPVLSAKIDQLEDITARIFKAVEEDPKKAGKIDTFLNYYLPTTQKLLDSYAQFEAAGVNGENVSQAKERIASTMDMILQGFSHQLDQLYKADAMDVDSDIRVMESMLRRDARTVADDFGFGKQQSAAPGTSFENDFGLGGSAVQKKPEDS